MRVNSTGLGKTTLTSHISELAPNEDGGLLMKIEATQPVHWHITCQMDPSDVRAAIRMALKPSVVIRVVKMALGMGAGVAQGDPAPRPASKPASKPAGKTG
jgi:energy-coupling factor transporter ATP-binding protein EcfA2